MNIVLGITGSIAAVKAPELITLLRTQGHMVRVVLTQGGAEFITPMACKALSNQPVYVHFEDAHSSQNMDHIELARWADCILIAPASANILAQCAHGLADQLLSTVFLATQAPVWMAPAMNSVMWQHPATQANIKHLTGMGVQWIGPNSGTLACGEVGPGRMSEPKEIVTQLLATNTSQKLSNIHLLITAGCTQEAIDPVRFLSNRSTGKMGLALAQAAAEQGAQVTCILGPSHAPIPQGIKVIHVISAAEMHAAVMKALPHQNWFIGCAAVSDYTPQQYSPHKLKKSENFEAIEMRLTTDILAEVSQHTERPQFVVGFAAETDNLIASAKAKQVQKSCDMMIANTIPTLEDDSDRHTVTVLFKGTEHTYPLTDKLTLARQLIDCIAKHAATEPAIPETV